MTAGDYVHVFGVPLEMLVWRRTMTHVFFWANHLGIYPAASVSLRAHRRLDTVVASSTSTTSNIICNILISVITLIQAFQGDLSRLAHVCMVWSGHNVLQFMPCPSLNSGSHLNICTADSMRQPCLRAHRPNSTSEPLAEAIILLNTDCSLSITCASLIVEKTKHTAVFVSFHMSNTLL